MPINPARVSKTPITAIIKRLAVAGGNTFAWLASALVTPTNPEIVEITSAKLPIIARMYAPSLISLLKSGEMGAILSVAL